MSARILVADDSINWSKPFCDFLNQRGYHATSVATGQELFTRVCNAANDYDILIMDNSMPETAGEQEIPYCGVLILGRLVAHFRDQTPPPAVLDRVIVRSIYSRQDMNSLRLEGDNQTELGCSKVALWLDRSVTLDELMRAVLSLSTPPLR
jgi:CheY-like chemotaxis protein